MSTATLTAPHALIELGTVYTVTWQDGVPLEIQQRLTPAVNRLEYPRAGDEPPSWPMIGTRLRRFIADLGRHGIAPGSLEFAPWTDQADIADVFARTLGFPGRLGWAPDKADSAPEFYTHELGGPVIVAERDHEAGAKIEVRPLAIGDGWVGLVGMVGPVIRVLAIPSKSVATITANMLSSSVRRTRTEALLFLAEVAHLAYPKLVAALNMRKRSTGKSETEARVIKMGELIGAEAALPCMSLRMFCEVGDRATLSIQPPAVVEPH